MLASDANHLDLDCGILYARIVAWLDDELALPRDGARWVFAAGRQSCLVDVEPLEDRVFGTIVLERSRLKAVGDAEALAAFEKLFTLRFVSAGG